MESDIPGRFLRGLGPRLQITSSRCLERALKRGKIILVSTSWWEVADHIRYGIRYGNDHRIGQDTRSSAPGRFLRGLGPRLQVKLMVIPVGRSLVFSGDAHRPGHFS